MRMEQLKYLVDIADTKSMSKTAERLFVSPQAVSKAIKQLEAELDAELLSRTNAGVILTKVGESVAALAEDMLREAQQMNRVVAEHKQQKHQERTFAVRICSSSAITNMVLPEIIARFSRVNVNIIPRISMLDSLQDILEQVQQDKYDIGLFTYNEEALLRHFSAYQNELELSLLARDEMVVVMNSHSYRSGLEVLSKAEYQSHFRSMYSLVPIDEMMVAAQSINVMRSNDADFHRAMIKKADACVAMPRLAYQHFFSGKSYMALPLEGSPTTLLHAAVYRKDAPEELQKFVALIRMALQ